MRKFRLWELLLVVTLVALGLGWGIYRARLARDVSNDRLGLKLADSVERESILRGHIKELMKSSINLKRRESTLQSKVLELEHRLAEERRRLAECEAKLSACEGGD